MIRPNRSQIVEIPVRKPDAKEVLDELRESFGDSFPVVAPTDWMKGQLLNVRNNGIEYVVTLLGEEFDPRYPHRALKFPNSGACQAFVSRWYAREAYDPRAF